MSIPPHLASPTQPRHPVILPHPTHPTPRPSAHCTTPPSTAQTPTSLNSVSHRKRFWSTVLQPTTSIMTTTSSLHSPSITILRPNKRRRIFANLTSSSSPSASFPYVQQPMPIPVLIPSPSAPCHLSPSNHALVDMTPCSSHVNTPVRRNRRRVRAQHVIPTSSPSPLSSSSLSPSSHHSSTLPSPTARTMTTATIKTVTTIALTNPKSSGRRHHKQHKSSDGKFPCNQCGYHFTQKGALRNHLRAVHAKERRFVCTRDGCDERFGARGDVTRHVASVHDGLRPFECVTCQARFGRKSVLVRHCRNVHGIDRGIVEG